MTLLFLDTPDVREVWGKLRFVASPLQRLDDLRAPSQGMVLAVSPDPEYGFELFTLEQTTGRWRLERFVTANFVDYSEPDAVLREPEDDRQWLGHTAMAQRGDTGEYLMVKWARGKPGHGAHFFRSQDGLAWEDLNPGAPAYTDHDACGLLWDPQASRYVMLQTTYQPWKKVFPDNIGNGIRRVLTTRTSPDGVQWEPGGNVGGGGPYHPAERLTLPDEHDPAEMEFYWLRAFPYEDCFVGMMLNYAASPQEVNPLQHPGPGFREGKPPSKHGPQLSTEWWISYDRMRAWRRPYRDLVAGGESQGIFHAPAVHGDRLTWLRDGRVWGLPLHRIAGAYCRANARFSTRPFPAPDRPLSLNARAAWLGDKSHGMLRQAYIMVEALDANNHVIPGYEREKCIFHDVDDLRLPLRWEDKDTTPLSGKTVSLRFHLRDATIFAVQEEKDGGRC
jgi:hypothetical protein